MCIDHGWYLLPATLLVVLDVLAAWWRPWIFQLVLHRVKAIASLEQRTFNGHHRAENRCHGEEHEQKFHLDWRKVQSGMNCALIWLCSTFYAESTNKVRFVPPRLINQHHPNAI